MDITDMIDYNLSLLNQNNLTASFFNLNRTDPTVGFRYDASSIPGSVFPSQSQCHESSSIRDSGDLRWRLSLGSHLAQHLRHLLEEQKGFTATVGISTNKLIAKLVGNLNKPKGQTTLIPPYLPDCDGKSHVQNFIDNHDIGAIPGIGFKMSQKIRNHILGRLAIHNTGLVYGGTKENVKISDVRLYNGMGPKLLDQILTGPGFPKDLSDRIWGLMHGVDDAEVATGRTVPQQISIEDSYIRLNELTEVRKELKMLATSLLTRMRLDLTSSSGEEAQETTFTTNKSSISNASRPVTLEWAALPRTIRLSTRPRPPVQPDGTRSRTFTRISKSGPMPTFVFSLSNSTDALSEKLVAETLMPLFRKLHPQNSGWDLSLVNVCATNMAMTASDSKDSAGRDISGMFKRQDEVLKDWKVEDIDISPSVRTKGSNSSTTHVEHDAATTTSPILAELPCTSENGLTTMSESDPMSWDSEGEDTDIGEMCNTCGAIMPSFAMTAHDRFHDTPH